VSNGPADLTAGGFGDSAGVGGALGGEGAFNQGFRGGGAGPAECSTSKVAEQRAGRLKLSACA
jgi:hypothetical protein